FQSSHRAHGRIAPETRERREDAQFAARARSRRRRRLRWHGKAPVNRGAFAGSRSAAPALAGGLDRPGAGAAGSAIETAPLTGRRLMVGVALAAALSLVSCEPGHNFTVFGYTTQPNYNCNIHTVYVPIFKNRTFYKGLEFDLTRAVIREIEAKTPYKVV